MNAARLFALTRKECLQIARDRSILIIGFLLPVMLILIFGFGLSMDIQHVRTGLVVGESTPLTSELAARFEGSDYFRTVRLTSRAAAETLMKDRKIDLIVEMRAGFTAAAARGKAELGVTVHSIDSNAATVMRTYVAAVLGDFSARRLERGDAPALLGIDASPPAGGIAVVTRAWFNEANTSTWYLVPGLMVVIMTLVGSFLTSIVVAREWERGTMPSLLVTPATALEILLSKLIPYFSIGLVGFTVCALTAVTIFAVPVRGSFLMLTATALVYSLWALSFGLFLSALVRNQFLANQYAIIGSFLPAMALSGFIFDLRSVPVWISAVGHLMPPTYAIESVKILFLSGGSDDLVLRNLFILTAWAAGFFAAAWLALRRRSA